MLVVTGVSGCGKSTLAAALAQRLGWDVAEGDDLHPAANVAKMAAGHPLTDDDRWPWLERVRAWIDAELASGRSGVITCSALKLAYRDVLRDPRVTFVYLHGSPEVIAARLAARRGHYMPSSLLASQFAALEAPRPPEQMIAIEIAQPLADQVEEVARTLRYAT